MKVIRPCDVEIGNLKEVVAKHSARDAVKELIRINDEHVQYVKCERDGELLKSGMHPLVHAIHVAYSQHLPVIISPDMIWYVIASGVAAHINQHAEELRSKFVDHQGKKEINIRRDDFQLNATNNPWHEVIDDFASKIDELTKNDVADIMQANFSTTTKDSRVISQIVLMDAMQKYFDFKLTTMCGIPEIRLSGSKDDWINVKGKTKKIVALVPELKKWADNGLDEILDHFINAFDDKIDTEFWSQIYKVNGGSGGPFITGWIVALFPYFDQNKPNQFVWQSNWREIPPIFSNVTTDTFDYHMNQVPFVWNYFGENIKMLFVGGLVGVHVESDKALLPVFGYAVTENKLNIKEQKK